MAAKSFEDLEVWRKAHEWVLNIYRITAGFPQYEVFSLTAQLRRAATSVPANIAEGFTRRSRQEKARFYNISQGSLAEARYYLILARDLGYADTTNEMAEQAAVARMLESYTQAMLAAPRSDR